MNIKRILILLVVVVLPIFSFSSCKKEIDEARIKYEVRQEVKSSLRCLVKDDIDSYKKYFDSGIMRNLSGTVKEEMGNGVKSFDIKSVKLRDEKTASVKFVLKYEDGQKKSYSTFWKKNDSQWKRLVERPTIFGGGY